MSIIRNLAPKTCPNCDAENTLYVAEDRRLTCRLCGHKIQKDEDKRASLLSSLKKKGDQTSATPETEFPAVPAASQDDADTADNNTVEDRRKQYRISHSIMYDGQLESWTRSIYDSGLFAVRQGKWDEALHHFKRAVDIQSDFTDAQMWIARLSEDEVVRRKALSTVVAFHPNNMEAIQMLMVLNGEITQEEADRAMKNDGSGVVKQTAPVSVEAETLACPTCGGTLTPATDGQSAHCDFCGHVEELEAEQQPKGYGFSNMTTEMIKERAKMIRWEVGERLLVCDNCGAERVLTKQELNARCPFCGSDQVIQRDALESFRQPDGVVPFRIKPDRARTLLEEALNSRMERFKGLFINNKVADVQLRSVYLPFWYFDMVLQVNKTIQKTDDERVHTRSLQQIQSMVRRETLTDTANDVGVPGFTSPPTHMIDKLGKFTVRRVVPYHPSLLNKHTAEIYTVPFDKASLTARGNVSEMMRQIHGNLLVDNEEVTVSTLVQQVFFRLVLLPVWVGTITEEDGDVRLALLNGQTGRQVLGRAAKRNKPSG